MLKYSFYIILILLAFSCSTTTDLTVSENDAVGIDSAEYELLVLDPDFNSWFLTHRKPIWFYTGDFYKYWNTIYVAEWNSRHNNPINYGTPYNFAIDYDLNKEYVV